MAVARAETTVERRFPVLDFWSTLMAGYPKRLINNAIKGLGPLMKSNIIIASVLLALALAGCNTVNGARVVRTYNVVADAKEMRLDFANSLNEDCTVIGEAIIRVISGPQHGTTIIRHKPGYSNFPNINPRSSCNRVPRMQTELLYRPDRGFSGADSVTAEVFYATGTKRVQTYPISVQ